MRATSTFNDGTTANVTNGVTWTVGETMPICAIGEVIVGECVSWGQTPAPKEASR